MKGHLGKILPRWFFMNNMNLETKAYFDTLPVSVRSAIVESGAKFDTVEQLKVLVQAYTGQANS